MKKIISFILAVTLMLGCSADYVFAKDNGITDVGTFQYEIYEPWVEKNFTMTVQTSATETDAGKVYHYELYDSWRDKTESTNVYPVKIKKFYPNNYFSAYYDTIDFDLDIKDDDEPKSLYFRITLYDGSVYVRRSQSTNKYGEYCVQFASGGEKNKKSVDAKIINSVWSGISKAEVFCVENRDFPLDEKFEEWLYTLDSSYPQYHISHFTVSHGKPSRHKVKFNWEATKNGLTGSDIYYEVYACSVADARKCERTGKCKSGHGVIFCNRHLQKLTTTKKTSYTFTKWANGKKLDLVKDNLITVVVRAKKKIDGRWITSGYYESTVSAIDINH